MTAISQTLHSNDKHWLVRILFALIVFLLCAFFVLGIEPYYKIMLLSNIGANPEVNNGGEFELSPMPGMPAAKYGLREGDILLAINNVKISSNVLQDIQELTLSPGEPVIIEVRGNDGTARQTRIPFNQPIPALFGLSPSFIARLQILLDILLVLGFLVPAVLILWLKSEDRLAIFIAIALMLIGFRYSKTILFEPNILAALVVFLIYTVARIFLLIFLFIFPNGKYIPSWTKRFVLLGAVWAVISMLVPVFYGPVGGALEIAILTAGLGSQIYRYRHISSLQEKQQTKWIVFGIVVAFAANYLLLVAGLTPPFQGSALAIFRYQLISQPVVDLSLLAIPVAVSISIFRYRLYEIDIIINRALVYGTLTAIVSGLAVALIGFFQRLALALTGETSEAATVITTLVVASAITPLKTFLQTIVDSRFKETPHASQRLKAFIDRVHKRLFPLDPDQITRQLLEEVVLAFQATSGAVYLDDKNIAHATRAWDGQDHLKIPIRGNMQEFGCLSLEKRVNGSEYTAQDYRLIEETVKEIALAIEQDQPRAADQKFVMAYDI